MVFDDLLTLFENITQLIVLRPQPPHLGNERRHVFAGVGDESGISVFYIVANHTPI